MMKRHGLKLLVALFALSLFSTLMFRGLRTGKAGGPDPAPAQNSFCSGCAAGVQCPSCFTPLTISPTLPKDVVLPSQVNFNCLAWQEFIALNWKAGSYPGQPDTTATAANFGEPNDLSPLVWMTYKEAGEVFKPDASAPTPWGSPQQLPASVTIPQRALKSKRLPMIKGIGRHVLYSISKSSEQAQLNLEHNLEAGTDAWLTAQNQHLTYYEIRLNQDEFNYVNQNNLYNANNQWSAVQPGGPGISLPDGTSSSSQYCPPSQYSCVGAIEVKAAWLEITDQSLWPQYLMTQAIIVEGTEKNPTFRTAMVGLVGLHIIHRTKNAQQFAWATFEHVSNAPDINQYNQKSFASSYTYFNPGCDPSTDPFKCVNNYQPKPTDPPTAPVQVVRMNPIDNTTVNPLVGLNCGIQNLIKQNNSNSVFQYYQLVNVLWPQSNTPVPAGAKTPLPAGNPQPPPNSEKVANTTLETYLQTQATCLDCHASAHIAPIASQPTAKQYGSSYSFLFASAGVPPPTRSRSVRPGGAVRRSR
jgi:hypothetical protein